MLRIDRTADYGAFENAARGRIDPPGQQGELVNRYSSQRLTDGSWFLFEM
ncbi:hypothetical protein ABT115_18185 [Streptomyces sp. NPDC001832]